MTVVWWVSIFLKASLIRFRYNDNNSEPTKPIVFITNGKQGVSYFRNTWHGVLTPIHQAALFAVVDYIGDEINLEEYTLAPPYTIQQPTS